MNRLVLLAAVLAFSLRASEAFRFEGKHFIASYSQCNAEALADAQGMLQAMDKAVSVCGAVVLGHLSYVFDSGGVTAAYLLSESHASIHTYPEHRACFVDLFTCGDHCSAERFDAVMRAYLQPQQVDARFLQRTEKSTELLYAPPTQE